MLASVTPRPKALLPFLLTMACLATSLSTPSLAQAGVMLNCTTTCMGGTCTVTAMCTGFSPNTCSFISEMIVAANNAMCTLGVVDGMAMVMANTGTSPRCEIAFSNRCSATTMCTGFATNVGDTCVVDMADGLPVELLDFKVSAGPKPPPAESSGQVIRSGSVIAKNPSLDAGR